MNRPQLTCTKRHDKNPHYWHVGDVMKTTKLISMVIVASAILATVGMLRAGEKKNAVQSIPNPMGVAQTLSITGFSQDSDFFKKLGTNGRTCATCHDGANGWSVTPASLQARFKSTGGTDPIFRPNDGAVCPNADVSTVAARKKAYALLLSKGLIRISMPVPPNADFQLIAIDDPYNCASATDVAMFRRPLPATNLRFLTTVMWDGRESPAGRSLEDNLRSQANDATLGHAQGAASLTSEQLQEIVGFEMGLTTAQALDKDAGLLTSDGAQGGVKTLYEQEFYIGINDPLGMNPTGTPFDPNAFQLYESWADLAGTDSTSEARRAIARGEKLFNNFPIMISGVAGLNDELGVAAIPGTCSTCHDAPGVGDHSIPLALNLGVASDSVRTPDMPLYTFRRISTGEIVKVTDPGRAMITGKWKDIGKFKGPILRGLATRAPYFHNGSAATLTDLVNFYDTRFNMGLTDQQKADLVAFLNSL